MSALGEYPYPDYEPPQPQSSGEAKVAAAVIALALHDAKSKQQHHPAVREQAHVFLEGSEWLHFWCLVANLDFALVTAMARRELAAADERVRRFAVHKRLP